MRPLKFHNTKINNIGHIYKYMTSGLNEVKSCALSSMNVYVSFTDIIHPDATSLFIFCSIDLQY